MENTNAIDQVTILKMQTTFLLALEIKAKHTLANAMTPIKHTSVPRTELIDKFSKLVNPVFCTCTLE